MESTIILAVVFLAVIIFLVLKVYDFERLEKEKTEKRLKNQGEIILNVLAALREAYGTAFKNSSLVYGYDLGPWQDSESGVEVSGIGALVSDTNQVQVQVAVASGTKQYIVSSKGNKANEPYRNFVDKTTEDDVSENGLVSVIERHYGHGAINKKGYHQVEVEVDEDKSPLIDPRDFFEINR